MPPENIISLDTFTDKAWAQCYKAFLAVIY
jgi:hypothetical protein